MFELRSKEDYKQVEVLGLLPTDRDPSAWLRMVARVFAAYKEVDVNKTIVAYISGFEVDVDLSDPQYYKFKIKKGTCFIDNQFIGFKDDVLFVTERYHYLPGKEYWLVLHYQWSLETDYNVAEFKVISPDLFDDQTMLKIRAFEITSAGEFNLLPSDLDDQYASNFKRLLNLAAQKIMDSIEALKFHYEVYNPTENKIDPSVKSGDFVFLDYITGKYKPARSCTKRLDKAVGIYLKDNTNNNDYIIYSGIVDFGDPRWIIHPDRSYLKNLEPGTSYYLADNCTETNVSQYYPELKLPEIDPGRIAPKFYPGLVRVGYALDHDKLFIQLDYTSEMNVQNLLELFGDSDRFNKRYKDFYEYYSIVSKLTTLMNHGNNNTQLLTDLNNKLDLINTEISKQNSTVKNAQSNYESKTDDLNNFLNNLKTSQDIFNNYNNIYFQYNKHFFDLLKYNIYDGNNYIFKDFCDYSSDLLDILDNIDNDIKKFVNDWSSKNSMYNTTDAYSLLSEIENEIVNIRNSISYIYHIYNDNTLSSAEYTKGEKPVKQLIQDYFNKNNTDFIAYSDNYYSDSGLITTKINDINTSINTLLKKLNNFYSTFMKKDNIRYNNFQINLSNITYNNSWWIITQTPAPTEYDGTDDTYKYNDGNVTCSNNVNTFCYTSKTILSAKDYIDNKIKVNIYDNNALNESTDILNSDVFNTIPYIYSIINKAVNLSLRNLKYQELIKLVYKYLSNIFDLYKNQRTNISIDDYLTDLDQIQNNFTLKVQALIDSKNTLDIETIKYNSLIDLKNHVNFIINKINQLYSGNTLELNELQTRMLQLANELGKDLDKNNPLLSIFYISNYQRVIYNYTYITQRLRIKYYERKIVQDRIDIINQKIIEISSQPVPDEALLRSLEDIKISYENLKNEINFEIETLTAEYNKIRTTYLGLEPISTDDPDFDDGGYAVSNLDCLETSE